ncbi:MAG TPA: hypothetical protein VFR09_09000 [Alphaproteobacteria bacterium]|nr:hypothetical protein [Alphaproteobacteria bacterium]
MSGQRSDPDQTVSLFLACAVYFIVGWLIWHFFKMPILEFMRWLRFVELWPINLIMGGKYNACLDWLKHTHYLDAAPTPDIIQATRDCFGVNYLAAVSAEDAPSYFQLSAVGIATLGREVTVYIHWPLALVFAFVAFYSVYISPRNKFRTKYDLEGFIKMQAKMWPVISPIVNFNPIKSSARIPGSPVPDKLPLFAEALSPEEWVSFHRINVTNNIPDREATRRAFLLQLGPRWNGFDGLPPYVRALIAAFALKGAQKREDSDNLLGDIATCWSAKGGFNMTTEIAAKVNKAIKDKEAGGELKAVGDKHAYRSTAMVAMLLYARSRGGVLAPAQFLWLRGVDRTLWYALNNLGRRAFHTEGAAAMAHFMAEQTAQKPLPIPRIDTAVITLNQYLAEQNVAIPPREKAR